MTEYHPMYNTGVYIEGELAFNPNISLDAKFLFWIIQTCGGKCYENSTCLKLGFRSLSKSFLEMDDSQFHKHMRRCLSTLENGEYITRSFKGKKRFVEINYGYVEKYWHVSRDWHEGDQSNG